MEPSFYKGDLLFLWWDTKRPTQTSDIIVYNIAGRIPNIPIVHRVISVHNRYELHFFMTSNYSTKLIYYKTSVETNEQVILTKGDNNPVDDRGLYNPGQLWLKREDILGQVVG